MPHRRLIALLAATVFLHGCVFVPVRGAPEYDARRDCTTSRMELQVEYLRGFEQCSGEGCAAVVAVMGITAITTALVAGSIVLVANAVLPDCH